VLRGNFTALIAYIRKKNEVSNHQPKLPIQEPRKKKKKNKQKEPKESKRRTIVKTRIEVNEGEFQDGG
jgi:hypothetical protein